MARSGVIVIDPFLLNSSSAELYLHYLLGLQLAENHQDTTEDRFVRVGDLRVYVHDAPLTSVEYSLVVDAVDHGCRLPKIRQRR